MFFLLWKATFWFVQFCCQWFPLLFSFFLLLSLTLLYSLMACAVSVYYHFGILTAAASLFYFFSVYYHFGILTAAASLFYFFSVYYHFGILTAAASLFYFFSVYYHFGILTAAASQFYGHMEFGLLIMMIVLSGLFSPLMVVTPASTCSVPTSFDVLSQCNGFQTDFASTSPFIRVPTPQNQGEILFLWLSCSTTLCMWLVQVACAWWALCMSMVCVCVFLCIYVSAGK